MDRLHWMGLAALLCALPACAGSQASPASAATPAAQEQRPTDSIGRGGRVGLQSFALAGRVTWQGLRTAGSAVRGLFSGGTGSARRNWDAGANRTREIARREAEQVKLATAD